MFYKSYLEVESDFIPVFSSSSDRTYPDSWKSFYPHENFKKILTLTIEALEKDSALKDRPLWISGSYGTGKTFASFVIKHILEDNLGEVKNYFSRREINALWQRVAGIRSKGKILVVHRSSSAGINSQNKLLNTIVESVKQTLRGAGYAYTGAASMAEKITATLKDPNATFNFRVAFKKYRGKFLAYASPEEVIDDLETLTEQERLDLLEDIIAVAEKEFYNWSMSVQDVIDWLRDVREKNNLYAIFFIWDEFTEYFRNNLNNITGLQEIAQNAAELSFYFFLITHSDANQLITDSSQRKIIEARFKIAQITLAENTAFKLMAQALNIKPPFKDEWEKISLDMWETVQRDAANFIRRRDESVPVDEMKKLLPIHPYAAYLLKFIAQTISSNQRTMFQFLCSDSLGSFKDFIESHGFEFGGDNFLTTDFMWDYFFQEDNPDLDRTFLDAMGHYNNFAPACRNENQRRGLKTALILFTLQQKNVGVLGNKATSLLRSTRKNICACFAGTPLENEVRQTLNYFVDRGVLSALEEENDTHYILATTQIDPDRMDNLLEQVRREKSFDAIIKDETCGVTKNFKPTDYLKLRMDIQVSSPTKILQTSSVNFKAVDNQIPTFYIFAVDEEEQGKVNQAIQKIREKFPERCIIADFSGTPFTRQRFEKFVRNKAREFYFTDVPNQAGQVRIAKKSAEDLINEWIRQLVVATVRVWSSVDEWTQVSGEGNFHRLLQELNRKLFGGGLEEISINDKLFSQSGLTDTVAKSALKGERIKGSISWLNFIGEPFHELAERGDKYWLANPSHVISKMKLVVENTIWNGFDNSNEVCLSDVWDNLKKPPVGLFKCTGTIFLFTLLLREYADNDFYVRDFNNNTYTLTGERLCNLIVTTVKELPGARDKFMIRQKPEHIKFCRITAQIFDLPSEQINSIDDALRNVKLRLTQSRYPLWALKCFVEEEYHDDANRETYLQFLNLLEEIMRPQNGRDATKIAGELFVLYDKNSRVIKTLQNIVRNENFKKGMTGYIAQYKPELKKIIGRLKLLDDDYLTRLHEKVATEAAYLWDIKDVNRQVNNLFDELRLVEAINSVLSAPQKKLSAACRVLGEKLNQIRIPLPLVEEFRPDLKELLKVFVSLRDNNEQNFAQVVKQIEAHAQVFLDFFENQFNSFAKALATYVDRSIDSRLVEQLWNFLQDTRRFYSAYERSPAKIPQ